MRARGGGIRAGRALGCRSETTGGLPAGEPCRHDKDQPTYWESCYYEDGADDGELDTPLGKVGVALCWEMIRSRKARCLKDKIELLLAGSTWWTLPDEAPADHPYRKTNLAMLQQSPVSLARMLGVPVIHASHAGPFSGFDSPELPDVPYDSSYLGESMICDAQGSLLARRLCRRVRAWCWRSSSCRKARNRA